MPKVPCYHTARSDGPASTCATRTARARHPRPPERVDGVSRASKPSAVGPRGPRLARRRRGLGPGRGVGNAQSRVRGGWKLLIALLENPKGSHPSGLKDTRQADKVLVQSSHTALPTKSKQTDASHSVSCQNPGATGSNKKASWRPPKTSKMQP